jgi:CO dehydrogenase maturation factor
VIVAVIGKGGVGKTTVTALLLRRLLEAAVTPVLAIDADPSSCLGSALGVRPNGTLGALRDRLRDDSGRPRSVAKSEWLALMAEEAIVEQGGFDLLTMGHPEGPGCYCFVNNLLRDYLDRLARSYRLALVDCEAGQEHLSRRTARQPDRLVCVTNRSRMGAETIRRALALYEGLHERLPKRVELVLNGFEPDEPLATEMTAVASGGQFAFSRVWRVPNDSQIALFESAGWSLLEIDAATPALRALDGWEQDL